MIPKNTILLIALSFCSFTMRAQDDTVSSDNCKLGFQSVILTGAPNIVNFYGYAADTDPTTGIEPVWYWDFGDGQTSNEQNPVHTFPSDGMEAYPVTLSYTLGDICSSTYSELVYMGGFNPQSCYAGFTWYFNDSIALFAEGYPISFIDLSWAENSQVISWIWDFGDGQTSTEQNPLHIYQPMNMGPLPPDYFVTLTIRTAECESQYTELVTLKPVYYPECQAYFYYEHSEDVSTDPELTPVKFYDSSIGNITDRLWDFGDGTASNEESPVHNYDFMGGPYVATLTITTDAGCVSTYSEYIRMGSYNNNCNASFYYLKPDSLIGIPELVPFQFFDISMGEVIKRSWDFGDGNWSNDKDPVHNFYFEGGAFMVTLTILTSDGCESSYSDFIYVGDPIIEPYDTCFYYINVLTGENPYTDGLCNGTATAGLYDYNGQQADVDLFYWSNGDEGISTSNLCYNTYYSVKTIAPNGCSVYSDFVVYNDSYLDSGMIIDPGVDWTTINDSLLYYFNYLVSTDSSWICVWDFGDGTTAEGANVSHEYGEVGVYNITLTIIDSTGVKVFSRAMEVNNATSLKKQVVSDNFTIFPNPVSDMLNIYSNSQYAGISNVEVMDVRGKTVYSRTFRTGELSNSLLIPVNDLSPGMYFARITWSGENPVTLKFIK